MIDLVIRLETKYLQMSAKWCWIQLGGMMYVVDMVEKNLLLFCLKQREKNA